MRTIISVVGLVGVPVCLYLNVDPTLLMIFAGLLYVPVWVGKDRPTISRAEYIKQLEREVGIEPWPDEVEANPWAWTATSDVPGAVYELRPPRTGKPQTY